MKARVAIVCVDGLYVKEGKMLLLKRAVEPFKDRWGLVGGSVEPEESLADGLKREFREETGLEVEVGRLLDERVENTHDRIKRIFTFEVTSATGEIKLNPESKTYGWFERVPEDSVFDYGKFLSERKRAGVGEK